MSQDFRLKFDKMREGRPTEDVVNSAPEIDNNYSTLGSVRNPCFIWPDGRMKFLNYAYLISVEYLPNDGTITMTYTTDTIIISGTGLQELYVKLFSHVPMKIECVATRYEALGSLGGILINDICVQRAQ